MATIVTSTIKSSGGDYTSISAWEAAKQGDLVTLDQVQQAECYAFNDTSGVSIIGWTTDATRYIRIYTHSTGRHTGKWDTTKYYISVTSATGINIQEDFVFVEGVQVQATLTAGGQYGISVSNALASGAVATIRECIVKGVVSATSATIVGFAFVATTSNTVTINCYNCVAFDFYNTASPSAVNPAAFYQANSSTTTVNLYNCIAYKSTYGFRVGTTPGTVTAKNCVALCDEINSAYTDFTGTMTQSYNCSSDATASGTGSLTAKLAADLDFTDAANGDFHIASTSVAKGAGTDLSGTFTIDLEGLTRSAPWDMGANKYTAAGGSVVPQIMYSYHQRRAA